MKATFAPQLLDVLIGNLKNCISVFGCPEKSIKCGYRLHCQFKITIQTLVFSLFYKFVK